MIKNMKLDNFFLKKGTAKVVPGPTVERDVQQHPAQPSIHSTVGVDDDVVLNDFVI